MKFSMLTYNTLYNKGLNKLEYLTKKLQPDIICFQEIITEEDNLKRVEKFGYKLADFSNSFIKGGTVFGIATFYKPRSVTAIESKTLTLPRSFNEIMVFILRGNNNPRTVLKTDFHIGKSKKKLSLYNVHFTAWATNKTRVKQLKETLNDLKLFSQKQILIAGDFNYPYKRKQFENLIRDSNLKEATNSIMYSFEWSFMRFFSIRLKDDYILYKNITPVKTEKVSVYDSDHFPIFAEFEI